MYTSILRVSIKLCICYMFVYYMLVYTYYNGYFFWNQVTTNISVV